MLKYLSALTAWVILLGAYEAVAAEWTEVTKEESRIVIYGGPFALKMQVARQASNRDFTRDMDYQGWTGKQRYLELFVSQHHEFGFNPIRYQPWETQAALWERLKGKALVWGGVRKVASKLGKPRYKRLNFENSHCIYFMHIFGANNIYLSGYYCQPEKISPEGPAKLLSLIGYRDEGVPDAPGG